jgi:NAD(P)-dependent dehydrogenase (short-subunit alcohol dehydrogenase family)
VEQLGHRVLAMNDKAKRVCLLTGASGRLGSLFCQLYGHRYHIAAVYRTQQVVRPPDMSWQVDPFDPTVRTPLRECRVEAIRADLTVPEQISRVVDTVLDSFGRVDLLINAAADMRCAPLLSRELTMTDVIGMLELNAVVPLRLALELAHRFWASRSTENTELNRNVVNVSSTSGAYIFPGQSAYSASKAALNMLTCHLADEFASFGVRVNSVAPDGFPHHVRTESVCDAIARIDQGASTGKMLLLEAEGETVV